jgi:hypothetical protein
MQMLWLTVLLIAAPALDDKSDPPKKEPAAKKDLFAAEQWYKDQDGKEMEFTGKLERVKGGGIGFGRMNPYRLVMKDDTREVYIGGKPEILADYLGMQIKLAGKAVDLDVEGKKHREIWPARLEVIAEKPEKDREPKKDDKDAARKDILAEHKLYKMEPGPEKTFTGTIVKRGAVFALAMKQGDKEVLENLMVYDGKNELIAPFEGKKVRLTGKQVMGAVGFRTFSHILPGHLVILEDDRKPETKDEPKDGKEVKILAQGFWRAGVRGEGGAAQQLVLRSAEDLAVAAGKGKDEAGQKEATEMLCKVFKVDDIDWKKQMIVVCTGGARPTGGYSVDILGLTVKDDVLTVRWKLNSPKPGQPVTQAFTHPAKAALVERVEGKVVFDPPAPKNEKDRDK